MKKLVVSLHEKLLKLNETSHSIALGSAIGFALGFTPLMGLKTLLSITAAWLTKGSKSAAVIAVTLHDLLLPFMPAIYLYEYKIGCFVLYGTVKHKAGFHFFPLKMLQWTTFLTIGKPILIGSIVIALPSSLLVYYIVKNIIAKAREKARKEIGESYS